MITRNILTAEQREQLLDLAKEIHEKNIKNGGDDEIELMKLRGAFQLIASAYSFYEEDN